MIPMASILVYGCSYSCCLAAVILIILILKKAAANFFTPAAAYYIWFVPFATVPGAFLPNLSADLYHSISRTFSSSPAPVLSAASAGESALQSPALDLSEPVPSVLVMLILGLWAAGAVFMLFRIAWGLYGVRRLCRQSSPVTDPVTVAQLAQCQRQLCIKRPVRLFLCPELKSPAAAGLLRPCILLPHTRGHDLPYVLLHELVHCKHWDGLFNFAMQIFLALNWHNPFVWYGIRQMETDRELCCDSFVLKLLDQPGRTAYGMAVIHCSAGKLFPAVSMKHTSSFLYKRVQHIADFHTSKVRCRLVSWLLLAVFISSVIVVTPSAYSLTGQTYEAGSELDIRYEDLSSYFKDMEGSFVLYDQNEDRYTIYNRKSALSRVSPNSTYKIYSSALALESNLSQAVKQNWDGTVYEFDTWNRNQTLNSAMKNSVNWYFQSLDRKLGKKRLQDFYNRIGYGNCDLTGGISRYWMESSLKISPLEQAMLLSQLYENKWNFQNRTIAAVKNALKVSDTLSGKTGTGMINGKTRNGWFIGYVESASGPRFFALNLQGRDGASGVRASKIAQAILKDKGLL